MTKMNELDQRLQERETLALHVDPRIALLITWKRALRFETQGLRRKGRSVFGLVKSKFNLKGNVHSVYTQYCELLEEFKSGQRSLS